MHSTQQPSAHQSIKVEVAGIIARLLLHYYLPGELSDAARKAIADDWLEDLVEFDPATVAHACREWRRTSSRRPTPSDIRVICIAEQRERQEHRAITGPTSAGRELSYHERKAALERLRLENRDAEIANGERLKNIREELAGMKRPTMRHVAAAALGVKARERINDPAELRAGRIALGLEKPEAAE